MSAHAGTCAHCGERCHYQIMGASPLSSGWWVHDSTGNHRGPDGHDANTHVVRDSRPTMRKGTK